MKRLAYITGAIFLVAIILFVWIGKGPPKYHFEVPAPIVNELPLKLIESFPAVSNVPSLKCKQYLVNFWATWCPPCLEEMPSLEHLYRQLQHDDKVCFVAVSVDDKLETVSSFLANFPTRLNFPIVLDKSGKFAQSLGITKFPETFLLGNEGKVIFRWFGPQDWLSGDVLDRIK